MAIIATAFYDANGTLLALPKEILNPYHKRTLSSGVPRNDHGNSPSFTTDPGYYHRFTRNSKTENDRDRSLMIYLEGIEKRDNVTLVDYLVDTVPALTFMDKDTYMFDLIYVVEDSKRIPYTHLPDREVHQESVSPYYRYDPVILTGGLERLNYPVDSNPDTYLENSPYEWLMEEYRLAEEEIKEKQ